MALGPFQSLSAADTADFYNLTPWDFRSLFSLHRRWRPGVVGPGGLFACTVALVRYGAGVGMIWGLFLGTAVMGFSLSLVTLVQIARVIRKKADAQNLA